MNTPFSLQNIFDIHQELFSDRNEGTGVFRNSALGVYWFLDANVNKVDIPNKRPWGAPTDGRCYEHSRYALNVLISIQCLQFVHEVFALDRLISHHHQPQFHVAIEL